MSVASCLRKAKSGLNPEDLDLLKQSTEEFITLGNKPEVAGVLAAQEVEAIAQKEHEDLLAEISIRGGVIPVGDAAAFSPKWGEEKVDIALSPSGIQGEDSMVSSIRVVPTEALPKEDLSDLFNFIEERVPGVGEPTWDDGTLMMGNYSGDPDEQFYADVIAAVGEHELEFDVIKQPGEKYDHTKRQRLERRRHVSRRQATQEVVGEDARLALRERRAGPAGIEPGAEEAPVGRRTDVDGDLGDGRSTSDFFSGVTGGTDGVPLSGSKYTPVIDLGGRSDVSGFTRRYTSFRGNFDRHIAYSIPGYQELQSIVGNAISQSFPEGTMLDIGASEGALAKGVASTSNIQVTALEPNSAMQKTFNEKPQAKGATLVPEAFGTAAQEGQVAWKEGDTEVKYFTPETAYDVVHEAMVFQFMSPNRESQITRTKELMKPDGVLIIEEKVLLKAEDSASWQANEDKKNEYKGQFFDAESLSKKAEEILVGMNANMRAPSAIEKILGDNFTHVTQFWDSGNFRGYIASDNAQALGTMVNNIGSTESEFSTVPTPIKIITESVVPEYDKEIAFSPAEGEEYFEPEPTFEAPVEYGIKDRFMTAIVDKFNSLTKTQKLIGEDIAEHEDVDSAVVRYPGMARSRIDDFELNHQTELVDTITRSGLSFEQAAEFLHARHAKEANAVLKRRNPKREDNKALSGMTDARADEILNQHAGNQSTQAIGTKVDQMNTERMQELVEDELLTPEEAKAWTTNYKHYVPLHRSDIASEGLPRRGRGFDVRGKESKLRAGSTREVDYENMFGHMLAQHETMIVRAEKNRVSQAMYNLASSNPNEEMWSTDNIPQVATRKADGTVSYVPNTQDPGLLVAKFNGEAKYVYFNTSNKHANQIISAMKNLNSQSTNAITKFLLTVNRYLSSINTSLSPEFVISNFFRDAQTAFYNLTDTEVKDLEGKIIKSIPSSMKGIHSALRGDGSHEWATWFNEFKGEGGMTGWMQSYDDIHDRMQAVKKSLKWDKSMGLRHIKGIMKTISDYNTIVENAVRLSTYRNAREAGLSKAKSARIAKEVTVNFNRRGEMAMTANALYLFYNAAVQGSARLLRAVSNPKNHRLHKMVGATIAVAAVLDIVNRLATDDDEEGKSKYDMVREKYGERNLIIMDWFGVTDDEEGIFFKIPLPWGYNVFHVLGQEVGSAISYNMGDYPEWKAWNTVGRMAGATLESFNPMQDGSLLQTLSPTVTDPLVRIAENKEWHGGPLYPNYNKSADNYTKFYSGARESSRNIAEWLAETFRDEETTKIPAAVDISPEWIDMAFDFTTGALGRFVADTGTMTKKLMTGETWEYKELPIARKLIGNVAPSDIKMEFYENYYEILDMDARIRKRARDGDMVEAAAMRRSVGPRLNLVGIAKLTKKKLTKLKKHIKFAKKAGNAEQVKKLEKRQLRIMNQYLKRYRLVLYNQ